MCGIRDMTTLLQRIKQILLVLFCASLSACSSSDEIDRYIRLGVMDLSPEINMIDLDGYRGKSSALINNPLDTCSSSICKIGLHGFMYDPANEDFYNPYFTIYTQWSKFIPGNQFVALGWDSVRVTPATLLDAWSLGRTGWYNLARSRADALGPVFGNLLEKARKPSVIVCHSLGCLVALSGLGQAKRHKVLRVLMINSAVPLSFFKYYAPSFTVNEIVNVFNPEDGVLRYASLLDTGSPSRLTGTQPISVANNSAPFDILNIQICARDIGNPFGFGLDNPNRFLNHLYSFEGPGMGQLLGAIIDGRAGQLSDPNCRHRS